MPLPDFPLPTGPRRRRGLVAAASVLALSALLVTLVPVLTARGTVRSLPAERVLTVASWNMCGVRRWNCADTGGAAAKRRAVERLDGEGADVVLLQEACAAEAESVRDALGGSWQLAFRPYTSRDRAGRSGTVRCDGRGQGAAGLALLSAHPLSSVRSVPSRQPVAGLRRGILCATVGKVGVRVCNAHLSLPGSDLAHPGREYRDDQLRALVAAVPRRRTVFGGDFNLNPPSARNTSSWVWPDAVYRVFRECDQDFAADRSGRPTHESGHKLDYLFTGLPRSGCAVRDTGVSDHRALLVRVDTG
ncbi:endonuclease/exonuclease/phosphatase family protein [Streptomyces sp. NPDC057293]|uniref:endonuclease/exonuclease/phosphatase family protein n=1 Tax=unclassified Streptomyces TaxID=2593676 RepID=UPI0036338A49